MAQQLVLLEVENRPPCRRRRTSGGSHRGAGAAPEWQLDERTITIGRRGLEDARRALRTASPQAA